MDLLYSAAAIDARVRDIATDIQKKLQGQPLVHVVVVMNGAFMFAADLVRQLDLPLVLHFNGGSYFEGPIKYDRGLSSETFPTSFNGAPVLVIEDILDSGKSIDTLRQLVADRGASQIILASLLKRQGTRVQPDHFGFTIPDNMFVVGYGLDMDGRFRELPDIFHLASSPHAGQGGLC